MDWSRRKNHGQLRTFYDGAKMIAGLNRLPSNPLRK
jgi:hypothetical protein